jgi:hypothetical protein
MSSGGVETETRPLGLKGSAIHKLLCAWLIPILTCSLCAQNTGAAVIYGTGSVYVNGSPLANSTAVTTGDVIQTRDNGAANINAQGSSIVVDSNSVVRFQGEGLALDRGGISVATGKALPVHARDFRIVPVSSEWTEFYVTRSGGNIVIVARKNDVNINCGSSGNTTVREGHQISRMDSDNCGALAKLGGAHPAANAPVVTGDRAAIGALAAGTGLTLWLLLQGDDPISPDKPGP